MINRLALGLTCSLALASGSAAHAIGAAGSSTNAPPAKADSAPGQSAPTNLDLPFAAEMILSLDRSKAIEQFEKTGTVPPSDDRMTTDDTLGAFYIVRGCRPDAAGNCNVTARFRIVRSDGSYKAVVNTSWKADDPSLIPFRVGKKVPEFDRKATYAQGTLGFLAQRSQGNFDPEEVAGDYLFLMTFTDNNGGNEINLWKVAHVSAGKAAQR